VARLFLAGEAVAWLVLAGLALRALTFARVAALASGPPFSASATRTDDDMADRIGWAVEAAARRLPWRPLCFERGLAAHMMLRRRGQPSMLHYGARSDGSLGPSAHVWVRLGARDVVGGEEAARFATLATFPAAPTDLDS
jgi:hypothetical protein